MKKTQKTRARGRKTQAQILEVATLAFANSGYEATSLDEIAGEVGYTKQTVLYHFESKEGLLEAVVDDSVGKLIEAFEKATTLNSDQKSEAGIQANTLLLKVVKSVFLMATRNPEVLGILREVIRLGGQWPLRVRQKLEPYMMRAQLFLECEMAEGRMKQGNPQFLLLAAYSTVIGVATEVELLRAMGVETGLKEAVVRRKELLEFLSSALK